MTPSEFSTAMFRAKDGESFVYFRGHLQQAKQDRTLAARSRYMIQKLSRDVMDAVDLGFGTVLQRRLGVDDYEYLFVRTVRE